MIPYRALLFGEALIDEFEDRRVVGGAPLHVAARLRSMGWDAQLVSRLGDDPDGEAVRDQMVAHGLDTSLVETDPDLPTSTVTVTLAADGPGFTIHRPVAWDAIEGPEPVPRHDAILFGTLSIRDERSRTSLLRLLADNGALRVADANLRPPDDTADAIRLVVAAADVLKVNDTELGTVAEAMGVDPDPAALLATGPSWLCVTRGAEGAELHHGDGRSWHRPAPQVEVIDTVGAGDAIVSGLIHGLTHGLDGSETLDLALKQAAQAVAQRGGFPREPGA